jgi:hypothetical protein
MGNPSGLLENLEKQRIAKKIAGRRMPPPKQGLCPPLPQ